MRGALMMGIGLFDVYKCLWYVNFSYLHYLLTINVSRLAAQFDTDGGRYFCVLVY